MSEFVSQDAPIKPTWIVLGITWFLCLIPISGVGIFATVLNIAAFILAIIVIVKGETSKGIVQLLASIFVTPIFYIVGLAIMGSIFGTAIEETQYQNRLNTTPQYTRPGNLPPIKWIPQSNSKKD